MNCYVGRGEGEIPKGGRAGRARSIGIWPRGGGGGGQDHGGGGEIPGTPERADFDPVHRQLPRRTLSGSVTYTVMIF